LFTVRTSKEADARYVVEGSVRRSGNSIRVSARLVDTGTGANVWAENYDRTLGTTSFFDLQDEITARAVSTIGSSSGPLVKAMAAPLRERPVADLSLHELVLRYTLYLGGLRIDEHSLLRTALEKALADQPNHALGWSSLSGLYEQELAWGMNPLPDSMDRATRAARRSVEIDPACQSGWSRLMCASFHTNDRNGMRNAGDRVLALNPLNQNTVGVAGVYFALRGDWERGIPMVRRAIDLDPNHFGMLHSGLFLDHFRKMEYDEALAQAKRINAFETATVGLSLASAAGQLGRADEARAAFEALDRNHPKHKTVEAVRSHWAWFLRENELIERLIEGFEKAQALLEEPASQPAGAKAPASGRTASIAVLPFTDMSAAKDQDWFCDGIAEEILNALAGLKGLSVAARASAFSFRGKGDDLKAIGEKLHVTTVLDGSVRRAGDQLRITVRLSDVANGYQLWSERYDRTVNDIFDVQDEIARAVAGRLRVSLANDPSALPKMVRHTENQEAYDLYLRGRHHWYSRNRGALQKARAYYEEATEKDPNYPLPWVGLADLYTVQGIYGYERETEVWPKARAAVDRALALNDRLGDTYRARGFMQIFFDWDLKAAIRSFERSIELDPSSGLSHAWLGWASVWPGRKDAAIEATRRARELDPLNIYILSISAGILDFWGLSEKALADAQRALDMDSNYLVGLYIAGGICSRLGRHQEALDAFSRAAEVSGRAPFFVSYLAWAQAMAGRKAEARLGLAELESRSRTEYVPPLHTAVVYSGLGDLDRAFALLEEAVAARNCWLVSSRLPMFDGFRNDPRFVEHLRRIGHPDVPGEEEFGDRGHTG
jgi:TolB-like protein/Tfp pilus assembly protein PilF